MPKLRLSAEACQDLKQIEKRGTAEHGPIASAAYLEGFRRLFQLLREHPFAGQEWLELNLGVRTLSHRPYRILYRTR